MEIIQELKGRIAATSNALLALREKRRPVALKAMQGDAEARKAIAKLDAQEAQVNSEHFTASLALEEAERLAEEERLQAAEAERQRRVSAAEVAAAEMLAIAEQIDAKAAEMVQLLKRRRELAEVVRRPNVLPNGLVNRFIHREPVDRALVFAGLHEFITIPRGEASFRDPLTATDRTLLRDLANGAKHKDAA
ncbi:hypothetical protein M1D80_11045 [Phyllobacteriaceae bacterium JZ32]